MLPTNYLTLCLLVLSANSLNPDHAQQNTDPDLDPNCLTLMVFLNVFLKKLIKKNKLADDNKSMQNYPVGKEFTS